MSYVENNGKFNVKKWNRENVYLEEEILKEEYIEGMDGLDEGLALIKDAWMDWRKGPETETSDIKPAKKEILNYVTKWINKNIK